MTKFLYIVGCNCNYTAFILTFVNMMQSMYPLSTCRHLKCVVSFTLHCNPVTEEGTPFYSCSECLNPFFFHGLHFKDETEV